MERLDQLARATAEVARLTALVDNLHVTIYEQRNEIDDPAKDVEIQRLRELLAEFVTDAGDDPCRLDHHGYCQAHGWFETNQPCLMARARAALAAGETGAKLASLPS